MENYEFKRHPVEIEKYEIFFDEQTANDILRRIRNSLQIFKRAYYDRPLTPDLWIQIDRIDNLAHGGEHFSSPLKTCISSTTEEIKR